MPSYLLGRVIKDAFPRDASNLTLFPETGAPFTWNGQDTLITDLHAAGARTALVGWHLPYSRMFQGQFVSAKTVGNYTYRTWIDWNHSFLKGIALHGLESVTFTNTNLALRACSLSEMSSEHKASLTELEDEVHRLVKSPALDFYWIHLPVPHYPPIPASGTYRDNLHLVDATLLDFRQALEAQGRWQGRRCLSWLITGCGKPAIERTEPGTGPWRAGGISAITASPSW